VSFFFVAKSLKAKTSWSLKKQMGVQEEEEGGNVFTGGAGHL
jgi:uncharacterized membrane protein